MQNIFYKRHPNLTYLSTLQRLQSACLDFITIFGLVCTACTD